MNDEAVRALVRQVVAARLGSGASHDASAVAQRFHVGQGCGGDAGATAGAVSPAVPAPLEHSSHGRLLMAPAVEQGQPCVIEPDVACGRCGFCESLGH